MVELLPQKLLTEGTPLTLEANCIYLSGVAPDRAAPLCKNFDINSGQMQVKALPIPERYLPDAADGEKERTKGIQITCISSLTFNPIIPAKGETDSPVYRN